MAVIFAGTETDAFGILNDSVTWETAKTAAFDGDFSDGCIRVTRNGFFRADFTGQSEGWLHFLCYHDDTLDDNNDAQIFRLIDGTNNRVVFKLQGRFSGGQTWTLQYWNGSSYTSVTPNVDPTTDFPDDTQTTFDVHWKINDAVTGTIDLFINGVSHASFVGDLDDPDYSTISRVEFSNGNNRSTGLLDAFFSEIIVADENTTGWRLATLSPTGNSATNTAWTGDFNKVDNEDRADGAFIASGSVDQVETYGFSNLSANAALLDVAAVAITTRARIGATGPQNLQAAYRNVGGASNHFSASMTIDGAYDRVQHVFDQNPDTVDDWTTAEVDAGEFGVKSIT